MWFPGGKECENVTEESAPHYNSILGACGRCNPSLKVEGYCLEFVEDSFCELDIGCEVRFLL